MDLLQEMESAQNSQDSVEPLSPTTSPPTDPVTPRRRNSLDVTLEDLSILQDLEDRRRLEFQDDDDADETTGILGTPLHSSTPARTTRGLTPDRHIPLFPYATPPSPMRDLFPRPRSPGRVLQTPPRDDAVPRARATIDARTLIAAPTDPNEPPFDPADLSLEIPLTEDAFRQQVSLGEARRILDDFRAAHALAEFRAGRIRQLNLEAETLRERIADDDARILALETAARTVADLDDVHAERLRRYEDAQARSDAFVAAMELELAELNTQLDEALRGREAERRAKDVLAARLQDQLQRADQREVSVAEEILEVRADTAYYERQAMDARAATAERDEEIVALRDEINNAGVRFAQLQEQITALHNTNTAGRGNRGNDNRSNGDRGNDDDNDDDSDNDSDDGSYNGPLRRGIIATLQGRTATAGLLEQVGGGSGKIGGNRSVSTQWLEGFIRQLIGAWPPDQFVADWSTEFPELAPVMDMQASPVRPITGGLLRGGWMDMNRDLGDDDADERPADPPRNGEPLSPSLPLSAHP